MKLRTTVVQLRLGMILPVLCSRRMQEVTISAVAMQRM